MQHFEQSIIEVIGRALKNIEELAKIEIEVAEKKDATAALHLRHTLLSINEAQLHLSFILQKKKGSTD